MRVEGASWNAVGRVTLTVGGRTEVSGGAQDFSGGAPVHAGVMVPSGWSLRTFWDRALGLDGAPFHVKQGRGEE